MTIAELRKALEQYPDDALVAFEDYSECICNDGLIFAEAVYADKKRIEACTDGTPMVTRRRNVAHRAIAVLRMHR